MFDTKPEVSLDTAVKAIGGAGLIAILGKQLIRIWRATKDRELAFYEKLASDLMIQNAALSVRLDTAQEHQILAVKRCAEMYNEQLKDLFRDLAECRRELRAREAEALLFGRAPSRKANGQSD